MVSSLASWGKRFNQPEYMCLMKKYRREWITWLVSGSDGSEKGFAILLTTRFVVIFLFLVGTRGAALPEIGLSLEAD